MADAKNKNEKPIVFDLADQPIIADTVFPKFSQF